MELHVPRFNVFSMTMLLLRREYNQLRQFMYKQCFCSMQIISSCTLFLVIMLLIIYLYFLFACSFCHSIILDESLVNYSHEGPTWASPCQSTCVSLLSMLIIYDLYGCYLMGLSFHDEPLVYDNPYSQNLTRINYINLGSVLLHTINHNESIDEKNESIL